MQKRSIQHTTFVIERTYNASPARVFAAWANPETKAQWFPKADEFDFRVGGREFNRSMHEGAIYTYDAHYQDIVPDQRIAYTYIMDRDEIRLSIVSRRQSSPTDFLPIQLTPCEKPWRQRYQRQETCPVHLAAMFSPLHEMPSCRNIIRSRS